MAVLYWFHCTIILSLRDFSWPELFYVFPFCIGEVTFAILTFPLIFCQLCSPLFKKKIKGEGAVKIHIKISWKHKLLTGNYIICACVYDERTNLSNHDNYTVWKCFLHNWHFVSGNHRPRVESHHKGPVMRSFVCIFVGFNKVVKKPLICR